MRKVLKDLASVGTGTIVILELRRGLREYWGVVRAGLGLVPVTLPMPLQEAQLRAVTQDVWTWHGGRARLVYPQGVKGPKSNPNGPEIDRGGPKGEEMLSFSLEPRWCHYHPLSGAKTHSFFGPPHATRIAHDECLNYE